MRALLAMSLGFAASAACFARIASAQSLLDEAWNAAQRESAPGASRLAERQGREALGGAGGLEIVEGYLDGATTGTGFGEDFLLGIPPGASSGAPRPLLLAWHGFGSPPLSVFRDTDYPAECAARGWFLLAPRGLDDKSFGFPPAQRNVRAVLEHVLSQHAIDRERLYAVGWSMGAQSVLCFAARHRDDACAGFAAVAALQGPHDVLDTYARENSALRAWLERLFGATPEVDERPYVRTSCLRLDEGRAAASRRASYALGLVDLPVLLVHALDDPLTYLRAQNEALAEFLRLRGAPVHEWCVQGATPAHDWRVVSAAAVCTWLAPHVRPTRPRSFELVSDGEASRGDVRLHPAGAAALASALVVREGASWRLTRLREVSEVEIEVDASNLERSAGEPRAGGSYSIGLFHGSGPVERLRVRGLDRAPLAVRRGRRALPAFEWSAEEGLLLEPRGAPSRWRIDPDLSGTR